MFLFYQKKNGGSPINFGPPIRTRKYCKFLLRAYSKLSLEMHVNLHFNRYLKGNFYETCFKIMKYILLGVSHQFWTPLIELENIADFRFNDITTYFLSELHESLHYYRFLDGEFN